MGGTSEFSVTVQLACAALGCTPADLSSVQAECTGLSAGQTYAGSDEQLHLCSRAAVLRSSALPCRTYPTIWPARPIPASRLICSSLETAPPPPD